MIKIACRIALITILTLGLGACASPQFVGNAGDADLLVRRCTWVLAQIADAPDASAARYLLTRAKAVAIFPGAMKAGLIFGGEVGTGVLCVRMEDGTWSPPALMNLGGANIGLQIGARSADIMMVVVSQTGLKAILSNNFRLGVDASAAAGPVGRQTAASLAAMDLHADVYAYSRAQGLFAGISLDSTVVGYDEQASAIYYGEPVRFELLTSGHVGPVPDSGRALVKALTEMSR